MTGHVRALLAEVAGTFLFFFVGAGAIIATGGDNLVAIAEQAIDRVLTQFPLLSAKLGVMAGNLSGGEQQILETAMVLEASPQLLLLDEPSLGLSPGNQDQIFETISRLREGGLTVLVVEQNAHGALQISDTGIVMELGRIFMAGPAAQVIADPRIKVAYLGGAASAAR